MKPALALVALAGTDQAMTYIADDITCDAPGAQISGAQQYRDFLGGFMTQLTGIQTVAAFGDDTTAVLFYYPHTATVSDAPVAECFTVVGGKITAACSSLTGHHSPRHNAEHGTVPAGHGRRLGGPALDVSHLPVSSVGYSHPFICPWDSSG
jgi:hypothetical protein